MADTTPAAASVDLAAEVFACLGTVLRERAADVHNLRPTRTALAGAQIFVSA